MWKKKERERKPENMTVVVRYACYLCACGCCNEVWIFVYGGGSMRWSALVCLQLGAREEWGFMEVYKL